MHNSPLSAPKQTSARIDFLRQGERLVEKMALTMLKFLLKVRQNNYAAYTREWATAQRTRALATASASSCRACCHGQRRQHHANAEVICHWQPGSQLAENVWNNFRQGRLRKHGTRLPQANGATFQISPYLHPVLCA